MICVYLSVCLYMLVNLGVSDTPKVVYLNWESVCEPGHI